MVDLQIRLTEISEQEQGKTTPPAGIQAHAPPLLPGAPLEIDIFQMELTSQLGLGSKPVSGMQLGAPSVTMCWRLAGMGVFQTKFSRDISSPGLRWHLLWARRRPGHCQSTGHYSSKRMGETRLVGQPQVLSGKSQCKHKHGKQKQEVEGLDHPQTCSDMLALPGCRGHNNADLCGAGVPP